MYVCTIVPRESCELRGKAEWEKIAQDTKGHTYVRKKVEKL